MDTRLEIVLSGPMKGVARLVAESDDTRVAGTRHPVRENWLGFDWLERRGFPEIVLGAVTALVYVAALSFGFVYDDVPQILKNPAVHAWKFVPQYFTAHVWAAIYPNTPGNYYRPIFLLWLRLNYALFGVHVAGWHATSILCHVLATLLVFRVVRQLARDGATAFVAALIFGLHPAHVENVVWISGVTDPLMACFALGSFSAFLSFRQNGGIWRVGSALTLFGLALLSKETAIVLPALILACPLIVGHEEGAGQSSAQLISASPTEQSSARHGVLLAGSVAVALIYFAARFHALRGWSHSTVTIGWREVFLSWPSVLWFYAKHMAWSAGLSEFYSLDYVAHYSTAAVLAPLAFLLIAALGVALALWFIGGAARRKLAFFALVLLVVPLLPVLDLRSLTAGDIVHDRYLYLPSVGFALLLALVIREIAQRARSSRAAKPSPLARFGGTTTAAPFDFLSSVSAVIVVALGVGFTVLTVSQQMPWASDILLYTRGLESAPGNLTVRDNLANALMEANQPERAIPLYRDVLGRNPGFWRSNYNLGFAYYETGNFNGAEEYLRRAIRANPADSDQYIYLALAQLELKKFPEAEENARRALLLNPQARGYHFVAGTIYERENERERAAEEFKAEIGEHPDNAAALAELQRVQSGRSSAAP